MKIRAIADRVGMSMPRRVGDGVQGLPDIALFGLFTRCLSLARCLRVVMMVRVVGYHGLVIMVVHMDARRLEGCTSEQKTHHH